MRPRLRAPVVHAAAAALAVVVAAEIRANDPSAFAVTRVESVGFTVADMTRAVDFYTRVFPFTKVSDVEVEGRPFELLTGVFGARARVVRLRLGDEQLELTEYLAAKGRPMPADVRPNDRLFQHIAVIVSDMEQAYARLRRHGVEHASSGPQALPDWNPNAGGIRAFYLRDPDRHFVEILEFPRGKGLPKWHARGRDLFLGIDHTAIVVADTAAALRYYRDALGLRIVGESENHGVEQEHLNGVFGARLRITTLRAADGPGIELLEYLAPRDGRAAPADLRASDVAHWQTTLASPTLDPLLPLARAHRLMLVSPDAVDLRQTPLGFRSAALTRDPDMHGMRIAVR